MQYTSDLDSTAEITRDNLDSFLAKEGIISSPNRSASRRDNTFSSILEEQPLPRSGYARANLTAADAQPAVTYLPQCTALNKLLLRHGYTPFVVNSDDIDQTTRSVSVEIVDTWANSLLPAFEELIARSTAHTQTMTDVSLHMNGLNTDRVSIEALESRLRRLQEDVDKAERAKEVEQQKVRELEEDLAVTKRTDKLKLDEARRRTSTLEMQLAESNRTATEREKQLEGLRAKLEKVLQTQRQVAASVSSPISHRSPASPSDRHGASSSFVKIQTTETTRRELNELRQQIKELTETLEDRENKIARMLGRPASGSASMGDSRYSAGPLDLPEALRDLSQRARNDEQRANQAIHQRDAYASHVLQLEAALAMSKKQVQELEEAKENLLLELQTRPSVKSFRERERRITELESRLHDAMTDQQRQVEMDGWNKHLNTRERIARDRKNHELGLGTLEDLPTQLMKDVLAELCRELELSDISTLAPAVRKLKTVVRAVPRMDRFISEVCSYVIAQNNGWVGSTSHRPTMEETLPILKSWGTRAKAADQMMDYIHQLQSVLAHRDRRLSRQRPHAFSAQTAFNPAALERTVEQMLHEIEELTELERGTLQGDEAFRLGDEFVQQHPEVLVSRLVNHIQSLFSIKTLEGMLPHMNKIYLFVEQMRNFLNTTREDFGFPSEMSDEAILKELDQILKKRSFANGRGHAASESDNSPH